MKNSTMIYKTLRSMAKGIPYRDIEIDIEALNEIGGGDFIIGIRNLGTSIFLYRKPRRDWVNEFRSVIATWPDTRWFYGSVNEGWIEQLSHVQVIESLKAWEYMHFAK